MSSINSHTAGQSCFPCVHGFEQKQRQLPMLWVAQLCALIQAGPQGSLEQGWIPKGFG